MRGEATKTPEATAPAALRRIRGNLVSSAFITIECVRKNPVRATTFAVLIAAAIFMAQSSWNSRKILAVQIEDLKTRREELEEKIAEQDLIWQKYLPHKLLVESGDQEIKTKVASFFDGSGSAPLLHNVLEAFNSQHLVLFCGHSQPSRRDYWIKAPNDQQVLMVRILSSDQNPSNDRTQSTLGNTGVVERYVRLSADTAYNLQVLAEFEEPDHSAVRVSAKLDGRVIVEKCFDKTSVEQLTIRAARLPTLRPPPVLSAPVSTSEVQKASEFGIRLPLWLSVDRKPLSLRASDRQGEIQFEFCVRIYDWQSIRPGVRALTFTDLTH